MDVLFWPTTEMAQLCYGQLTILCAYWFPTHNIRPPELQVSAVCNLEPPRYGGVERERAGEIEGADDMEVKEEMVVQAWFSSAGPVWV